MDKGRASVFLRLALAAALVLGVLLGPAFPWDEGEHGQVAWLMGALGQEPMEEFFQHHQPVLWDLLAMYYQLGGEGPGVLLWGRVVAALSVLLILLSLPAVVRYILPGGARGAGAGGALAMAALALVVLLNPSLLVSRPETLAAGLLFPALALWLAAAGAAGGRGLALAAGAGALFAMSGWTSPRFALVAPLFLIPLLSGALTLRAALPRVGAAAAAGVVAIALYHLVTGHPVERTLFYLSYSSTLQGVGDGHVEWSILSNLALLVGLPGAALAFCRQEARRAGLFLVACTGGVWLLSWWSSGLYHYSHCYVAIWPFLVVLAALLERTPVVGAPVVRGVAGGAAAVAALLLFNVSVTAMSSGNTILDDINTRATIAKMVPRDDTVLTFTRLHPITRRNASWYGPPMADSPHKLCHTVAKMDPAWGLRPCDYTAAVRQAKPALIEKRAVEMVPDQALYGLVRANYVPVDGALFLRRDLYARLKRRPR